MPEAACMRDEVRADGESVGGERADRWRGICMRFMHSACDVRGGEGGCRGRRGCFELELGVGILRLERETR